MKRASLVFLTLTAPALLAAQLVAAPAGLFALLSVLVPVALIALGAARGGRVAAPVAWVLAALAVVLEGAAIAVLGLSGALAPRIAALPPAAVAEIAGFWLLPLPLVALGYALTFRRTGPTPEDLRRLRERLAQLGRPAGAQAPSER